MLGTCRERAKHAELSLTGELGMLTNLDFPTGRSAYGRVRVFEHHERPRGEMSVWQNVARKECGRRQSLCFWMSVFRNFAGAKRKQGRRPTYQNDGVAERLCVRGQRGGIAAYWSVSRGNVALTGSQWLGMSVRPVAAAS